MHARVLLENSFVFSKCDVFGGFSMGVFGVGWS